MAPARSPRSTVPSIGPASPAATATSGANGATENHSPFTVVALGDSVPTASTCGCTGYVELLADQRGS